MLRDCGIVAAMRRSLFVYALALAVGAWLLEYLKFRHSTQAFTTEIYVVLLAVGFIALGLWLGQKLTPRPKPATFERNEKAVAALGLTERECEILERLATGRSLKELARDLDISPNTVKTHVAQVYAKLGVNKRVNALEKARALSIIA